MDSHAENLNNKTGQGSGPVDPPEIPEARQDRLARIRLEIARGDYDTPERFEAALERMFEALASSHC